MSPLRLLFLLVSFSLILATSALAGDGVIELNQTCATATGCMPGDSAGFPISIVGSSARSYMLTSDLVVPDDGSDGISISTPRLSIDLNGFSITRSGCENAISGSTCPAAAVVDGTGIVATSNGWAYGHTVKNGSVVGMGAWGIALVGGDNTFSNIRVKFNGIVGLDAGKRALITGVLAYQNGDDGIRGGDGSVITNCRASGNGNIGIKGNRSVITESTATENVFIGIQATGVAARNVVSGNLGEGIRGDLGALIESNLISGNQGVGINVPTSASYRANSIYGNQLGTVVGGGVNQGSNHCEGPVVGTPSCP